MVCSLLLVIWCSWKHSLTETICKQICMSFCCVISETWEDNSGKCCICYFLPQTREKAPGTYLGLKDCPFPLRGTVWGCGQACVNASDNLRKNRNEVNSWTRISKCTPLIVSPAAISGFGFTITIPCDNLEETNSGDFLRVPCLILWTIE